MTREQTGKWENTRRINNKDVCEDADIVLDLWLGLDPKSPFPWGQSNQL